MYTVCSMASWLPTPCLDAVLLSRSPDATARVSTPAVADCERMLEFRVCTVQYQYLLHMAPVSIMSHNGRVVSLHSRFKEKKRTFREISIKKMHKYIHMHIYRAHNFCTTTTKLRHTAPVVTVLDKILRHGRFLIGLKIKWEGDRDDPVQKRERMDVVLI